ncbi:MAG TPA: dihydropteroate synthase, partial [Alphaproteobacteria bacterium]|nr:dihydropteroate synthase [Alphaproteobacteria bacterium]
GAEIINDVTALTHDAQALKVAAAAKVPVILMHMQGTPQTMQKAPSYARVECDIFDYFEQRIAACEAAGIPKSMLVVDPGIGFGKTPAHNAVLLRRCGLFHQLGVPVMMGASRKSFIHALAGPAEAENRLPGSLTAALMALSNGVQMLRVHDVAATKQAVTLWQALHSTTA